MPSVHLTKKTIDELSAGPKDVIYWDKSLRGFGLKVTPTGRKVFLVLYRTKDGLSTLRKFTIGVYGQTTPVLARTAAQRVLAACSEGKDPALEKRMRRQEKMREAFDEVAAEYIRRRVVNTRSAQETTRVINRELVTRWCGKSIHSLAKKDVIDILDGIVDRGSPGMANQAFIIIRALFNWCVARGLLEKSPCVGLSKPSRHVARDRILTDEELARVIHASRQMGYPYGSIVETLAFTAQRRQEVAGAKWSELDLEKHTWTIPAERAKNGKAHSVFLAPRVKALLKSIEQKNDHIFVTSTCAIFSDFSDHKKQLDLRSGVSDWVIHDLRRTAVTGMARLGVPPHIADKILNHQTGSIAGVAAVYQRFEFLEERTQALRKWAEHLEAILSQGKSQSLNAA